MASESLHDPELEAELKDIGTKLLDQTSSIIELLGNLNKAEFLLARVGQKPSESTKDAIHPIKEALIRHELLYHAEADIKALVFVCIHIIMSITAPDAPYDDEEMKEIFKQTVKLFEKLSLPSGHCFTKAVSVLHSMAKVRSCVMMLDLELEGLIFEMFQLFFKVIRPHHPESVFPDMVTIMSLIINEMGGEELSMWLLSPLLANLEKGNQDVTPLSFKLGENVFKKCADTLKPYLHEGLRLNGSDMNNYVDIVSSLLKDPSERDLETKEPEPDAACLENENPSVKGSSTCIIENNGAPLKDAYILGKDENTGKTSAHDARSKGHKRNSNSPSQNHSFAEENPRKRGRPKRRQDPIDLDGDASRGPSDKKKVSFSASRSKNEKNSQIQKSIGTSGKKKHTLQKEKKQVSEMPRNSKKYGEEIIGRWIEVWWPLDETFYKGVVYSYNPVEEKHRVLYTDNEEELLDLCEEQWQFVEKNEYPDQGEDDTSKIHDETKDEEQKDDSRSKIGKADEPEYNISQSIHSWCKSGSSDKGKKMKNVKTPNGGGKKGKLPGLVKKKKEIS